MKGRLKNSGRWLMPCLVALSFFCAAIGLSLGAVKIPLKTILGILVKGPNDETDSLIIWTLRFPRVLMAFVEGAGLSVSGAVMQGLFRNPIADPYILGISSGASLGAVLGMVLGLGGFFTIPLAAFLGALLTIAVVYRLATSRQKTDTFALLLSGIAISSFVSSLIALIMVVLRDRMDEIVFWTMGALSRTTWGALAASLPYVVLGGGILFMNAPALNAITFGEEPAYHMGIDVEKLKKLLIFAGALATAANVAFTGPIGFVGLIVPHGVRILSGPDYRHLLPLSAVAGGNTLILADLLARTIVAPRELPVGVVTALFGAPFFLALVVKMRRGVS